MARKKRRPPRLDDLSKWRIDMLGQNGGFSHRGIAAYVFDKPINRVTTSELDQVSNYLWRQRILVTEWRNGVTSSSQSHMASAVKVKRKKRAG